MATRTVTATDIIELIVRQPWRVDPHTFAAHISGGKWIAWPYLAYIGERITDAIARGNGRLIVNMPPGHGKSSLLSHWVPTWFLDNLPHQRIIAASHGAELAESFGRSVRNEFERNPLLTTRLAEDSSAAGRWNTPDGGGMVTTGVGGGITGWRGNLILVDDPHPSWEAVNSETHRKRVAEWFNGTLRDRGEPGATIVLLMHRWHEQDLVGQLLEADADEWEVIRLPALAEDGDALNRAEGESLCPDRYPVVALEQIRKAVGSLVWFGKYQQHPQPPSGNYFKREWFEIVAVNHVPRIDRMVRCWDLAATAEEEGGDPDWLAGVRMGKSEAGDYFILDVLRQRLSAASVESAIQQMAQMDGRGVAIRVEREGAASGKLIAHHFTRMLDGWDARFTGIPRGSKFARSGPFNAACERRQVKLVAGDWNREFIDEASAFPLGAHDDMVDASVGAYMDMTGGLREWDRNDLETVFGRRRQREKTPYELLMEKLRGN